MKKNKNPKNNLSKEKYEQAKDIVVMIKSMFSELNSLVKEIITANYSDDIVKELYTKIYIPYKSTLVNIEIFNSNTNIIICLDIPLFDFLRLCSSEINISVFLNDKVKKMIDESYNYEKQKDTKKVYLENLL